MFCCARIPRLLSHHERECQEICKVCSKALSVDTLSLCTCTARLSKPLNG